MNTDTAILFSSGTFTFCALFVHTGHFNGSIFPIEFSLPN